jgi:hypothetical protein
MTETRTPEPFETRFADRIHVYTDVATVRPFDALAISRAAMSSKRSVDRSAGLLGSDWRGWRVLGLPWAAAAVAVMLIGVMTIALLGRPSDRAAGPQPTPSATPSSPAPTAGGPIAGDLLHSWGRPYAVFPGLDPWPSGLLHVASDLLEVGPEPGDVASSAIAAAGPDLIALTATGETPGCTIGDVGTYRWSVEAKGSTLTLTAIDLDACATRETALAGSWVRIDYPNAEDGGATLAPGTYRTSAFDPFGDPALTGQLSYTVPTGWKVKEDQPATFMLHLLPEASISQPTSDSLLVLLAQPQMAADFEEGSICGQAREAPGVGDRVDEIVAAIQARPSVVSSPPVPVTFGGYRGQMLDLRLADAWTGGCQFEPEGLIVGTTILRRSASGSGPFVAVGPNVPVRLILLDLTDGRTMAIATLLAEPFQGSVSDAFAAVMPVIESFEFHPPAR